MALALPNPLNPINPAWAGALLGKFAASDAKHDFSRYFISIFQRYNDIGTSGIAPIDTFDEWGTLSNVFRNNDSDTRNDNYIFKAIPRVRGGGPAGDRFKTNVLNTRSVFSNKGLSGISLNTALGASHTYKLRSMLFSTGTSNVLSNSEALLDFLGSGKNEIYIQQDASFISFSDFFLSNKNIVGGEGSRKHFYYLGSREGQNDAAGKTNSDSAVVKKTGDKKVSVSILDDISNDIKNYPKYSGDQNSDVTQNFQSIYNLSITPVKLVKGVKTVSLNFYNKEQVNATQKGKAENAKGNLIQRLTNFLRSIATGQNSQSYFTALQQKRSGDWLQVLSTYDLTRYKDTVKGRRGILITHDFICGAYAIAMGVDVVLTIQYNEQKWIVFFENELYQTKPTKNTLYERFAHIETNIPIGTIRDNITEYTAQKAAQMPLFIEAINAVQYESFTGNQATILLQGNADKYIKDLLKAYFRYTIVLLICPDAEKIRASFNSLTLEKNRLGTLLNTWNRSEAAITDEDRMIFSEYEKTISDIYNIKESLRIFFVEAGGISIMNLAKILTLKFSTKSKDIQVLSNFLDYFSPFSVETPSTPDTSTIFLNRFRSTTAANVKKKNDYGVFSMYLNKLAESDKTDLYTKILAYKTKFSEAVASAPEDRTKPKKQELEKNFGLFIDEIKLYFNNASAPSFEAGTTGELLIEINGIQSTTLSGDDAEFTATIAQAAPVRRAPVNDAEFTATIAQAAPVRRAPVNDAEFTATIAQAAPAAPPPVNDAEFNVGIVLPSPPLSSPRPPPPADANDTEFTAGITVSGGSGRGNPRGRSASRSRAASRGRSATRSRVASVPAPIPTIDSIVSSTPFTSYLVWLLTKRNNHIRTELKNEAFIRNLPRVVGIAAVGTFCIKTAISSLLSSYLPPMVSDIADYIVLGSIGIAGSILITTVSSSIESIPEIEAYTLTTNAYSTLYNDKYIQKILEIETKLRQEQEKRGRELRVAAATARGYAGGKPLESFDLSYSNWATLFYHMDTMRTQLNDIHTPDHGFDYAYFARYSQFLIAMEQSIDSTIAFFTIKSPKKGGQSTTTVVLTDEPSVKSRVPTELVLRLKGGPLDLYEVSIGYCGLFTSFGNYCDLILSNLLPRIYFDSVWDELKPMLSKAFTGSDDPDTKWIGLVAETCNDSYLNTSADTNLHELFNPNDLFLRYFLITICHTLEQMPLPTMTISSKESLERELDESIQRLLTKINRVEKNIIVHMYKKKVNDDSINFETINDLGFLMKKNLLIQPSESTSTEGGRRKRHLRTIRRYRKTKKNGRKMRLKSHHRTYKERR